MRWARSALAAGCLAAAGGAAAQDPGVVEDVPYVASPQLVVDEMLRIADVGPRDVVYDLGSGDGRIVITAAAKFGARAVGVDIDPAMVRISRANVAKAGLDQRVRVLQQDALVTDLTEATVVTLYLPPYLVLRLRDRLLKLRPGTRIVSHSSDLGDWQPDLRTSIRKDVLLWYVPAAAGGAWRATLEEGVLEIALEQRFQVLKARAALGGRAASVWAASLRGAELRFVLVDPDAEKALHFTGRVSGDTIEGEVSRDVGAARRTAAWRATKVRSR